MAEREVGVGVIGFGLGGRVFHAPFVSAVPGLRLVSIMQRNGRRGGEGVSRQSRSSGRLRSTLADKSVERGGRVHAERDPLCRWRSRRSKPASTSSSTSPSPPPARRLGNSASSPRARGCWSIPFHNRRWDGDFQTVRKLLQEGAVGRLVTFESHFDRFRPIPRENTWKEAGNPANGMLFDLGPHLVDQVLALFGAPDAITASVRADRDQTAIEDAFDITLHYPGKNGKGMLAHCRTSYLACDNAPRFLLHGTKGSFKKHGLDPQEPALVGGAKVPMLGSKEVWLQEKESAWGKLTVAPVPADPAMLVEHQVKTELGDYRGFYANVRDAVLGTAPLAVTPEDGYRVIRLLEMARESSAKGCTLKVAF